MASRSRKYRVTVYQLKGEATVCLAAESPGAAAREVQRLAESGALKLKKPHVEYMAVTYEDENLAEIKL